MYIYKKEKHVLLSTKNVLIFDFASCDSTVAIYIEYEINKIMKKVTF